MRTRLLGLLPVLAALAAADAAEATITCAYNAGSKSLSITSDGNSDSPQVGRASGSTTIVVRSDSATVVACSGAGTPTVTSVDVISYNDIAAAAQNSMTVDLSNGPLAPGATSEALCCSEIEMNFNMGTAADLIVVRGSDGPETVRAGTPGSGAIDLNLNPGESAVDQDVHVIQVSQFRYDMADGDDVVDMRGGAGTGAVLAVPTSGEGDEGNDTIVAGDGQNYETGGAGNDTIAGGAGSDVVSPGPGNDVVDGGGGTSDAIAHFGVVEGLTIDLRVTGPQVTGLGTDTFTNIETVYAADGDDVLIGNGEANTLLGYGGDDRIIGGAGNDYLTGDAGFDTVDYSDAPAAVTVKLGFSMQQQDTVGAGMDIVDSFEAIRGSPFADTLTGDANGNVLEGLGGADTLVALGGPDTLLLRDGEGDTADCGGDVDTAITDVAGADALTGCEIVQAADSPASSGSGAGGEPGGGPGGAGGGGSTGTTADAEAPLLSRLLLRPRSFRAARGARLQVVSSEAAALAVIVERCRARRCRPVRRTDAAVPAGNSTVRLRTAGLRPGRYRARVVARDAAGNRSAERRARFRVMR